jgi:hypothetical protein
MEKEEEGHLPFLDIDIYRKRDGSLGHQYIGNPPLPISTYNRIRITILLTNNQSSRPSYTESKLSVTRIPSPKN